jgi:hypothetical protein
MLEIDRLSLVFIRILCTCEAHIVLALTYIFYMNWAS